MNLRSQKNLIQRILTEAKNLRGHKRARNAYHGKSFREVVSSALRPQTHQSRIDTGEHAMSPRFLRLQEDFRRSLMKIITKDNFSVNNQSLRLLKKLFRSYYKQALSLGKSTSYAKPGLSRSYNPALNNLTKEDLRWLETFINKEFKYFKRFLYNRENLSTNNYNARINMYINTLSSVYATGKTLSAPVNTLFYWDIHPGETCPHCIYLKNNGPYTVENLPTVPRAGDTMCLGNCKCNLRRVVTQPIEYQRVKAKSLSREEHLRRMKRYR